MVSQYLIRNSYSVISQRFLRIGGLSVPRIGITQNSATGFLRHFSSVEEYITVNWRNKDKSIKSTRARIGSSLLTAAHSASIDIEGACEGVCACSTCHVILENEIYDKLPEASEEEEDLLDQAFGLTASSRLGCQVLLTKAHDGMIVTLPSATRNFYVDGHKPKHH